MKIELEPRGEYLLVKAKGRLDVSWADYFTETLVAQIREGRHKLVIDASEMIFLSSAGIRALLQVFKNLNTVGGKFLIVKPTAFVKETLSTSGFQAWLGEELPAEMAGSRPGSQSAGSEYTGIEHFTLPGKAGVRIAEPAAWRPWRPVDRSGIKELAFSHERCGLGIGSATVDFDDARDKFGEFLAVAGNVVYQPPEEQGPPDYLIAEKEFIPRMLCLQAITWECGMGSLMRFSPTGTRPFYPVSVLLEEILRQSGGKAAGFVMLGEIEGFVGSALIRSPGLIGEEREIGFPEIRDWLSFSGERSYSFQQALLAGVVSQAGSTLVPPVPSVPGLAAHIHAAVFPHQPLPNGRIELEPSVRKFFNGPAPQAVMHLAVDSRPVVGLGESALIRGACWYGPVMNAEVMS